MPGIEFEGDARTTVVNVTGNVNLQKDPDQSDPVHKLSIPPSEDISEKVFKAKVDCTTDNNHPFIVRIIEGNDGKLSENGVEVPYAELSCSRQSDLRIVFKS
jgi:hypothetical protein